MSDSNNTPDLGDTVRALTPARERVHSMAQGMVIKTADQFEAAAALLKSIKGSIATIEDARVRITKPINESLREVNAQAKAAAAPFLADEFIIKGAMVRFSDEQDKLRQEEQRKANAKADADRRRLLEAAQRNAAKGNEGKAEQFEARAQMVVAPIAQHAAPKIEGVSIPTVWAHEIVDEKLIPREYLDVSETRIRQVVTAMKGNTNIPGVRVFQRKRIASTSS